MGFTLIFYVVTVSRVIGDLTGMLNVLYCARLGTQFAMD